MISEEQFLLGGKIGNCQPGRIQWITKKGYRKAEILPRLKTVEEVLKDPEPDQSWMDTPLERSKFIKWIPESVLKM